MSFELPRYGSFSRPLVVGAGRSGLAAARLLSDRGAGRVVVADAKPSSRLEAEKEQVGAIRGAELIAGGHPPGLVDEADLVVVSPGVPLADPLFARAREKKIPVIAEVELARPFLSCRVIGITGSNGKSTTTALVAEIGRAAGLRSEPAGNFGPPLSGFVGTDVELLAVELSSFQLEAIRDFRSDAAVLLNVTPDHMDRYPSFEAYAAAKARIFSPQKPVDSAVVNADDPRTARLAVRARRIEFSRNREVATGTFVRSGLVVWRDGSRLEELLPADRVRIPGPHNLENALAAAAAARAIGLPAGAVANALAGFAGLAHRCEPAGEIRGISFVNDSKGTNVDAALKSFSSFEHRKVWLILGGRDKAGDFSPLVRAISSSRKSHAVLAVGEAAPRVLHALSATVPVIDCATIERAVDIALERGQPGDVVLLSPACASFDQFRNFEHRGEEFKRIVRERMTPSDAGENA